MFYTVHWKRAPETGKDEKKKDSADGTREISWDKMCFHVAFLKKTKY